MKQLGCRDPVPIQLQRFVQSIPKRDGCCHRIECASLRAQKALRRCIAVTWHWQSLSPSMKPAGPDTWEELSKSETLKMFTDMCGSRWRIWSRSRCE